MDKLNKAMILGAGLATRMRPLTDNLPKPLIPWMGKTLFEHTLQNLKNQGIQSVSVNTFHAKEVFHSFLVEKKDHLPLLVKEFPEPYLLGTGGGIYHMRTFAGHDDFLVMNCDFICDVDIQKMFEDHKRSQALATLALISGKQAENFTNIEFNENMQIQNFKKTPTQDGHFFSGVTILSPEIFSHMTKLKAPFCIVKDVFTPLLQTGKIHAFTSNANWVDLGELSSYSHATMK